MLSVLSLCTVATAITSFSQLALSIPCINAFQFTSSIARLKRYSKYSGQGGIILFSDEDSLERRRRWGHYHLQMKPPLIQEEELNGDATSNADEKQPSIETEVVVTTVVDKEQLSKSTASTSTSGITASTSSRQLPTNWLGEKTYILFTATLIGLFTGTNIAIFKTVVEFVRRLFYSYQSSSSFTYDRTFLPLGEGSGEGLQLPLLEIQTFSMRLAEVLPLWAIPVLGGVAVGAILRFGGDMPPGLRDTVKEGM